MRILFGLLLLAAPVGLAQKPLNGDLDLARRLENAFVTVAAQASESVVVIRTKATVAPERDDESDDPFERFFRRYHGMPAPRPKPRDAEGQGSGIILRPDGHILTNGHVVDGADSITVRLKDGREFAGKLIGQDSRTDVAILKIEAEKLPVAKLGDSDAVKVGQWAVAIGAPFELDYSFTVGFISAKGRSAIGSRGGSAYEDYIQTDASINPGNSGGPLCDIEGRVIGINTLIRGLNTGIGFAIPINMAKEIAGPLIEQGKIVRPWIGIALAQLAEAPEIAGDVKEGVIVQRIEPGTPAAQSDLLPADIIVKVDDVAVKSPREVQQQVLKRKVGATVTLEVVRAGQPVKVAIQTAEMGSRLATAAPRPPALEKDIHGIVVEDHDGDGAIVTGIVPDSPAMAAELQRGDLITGVNRQTVRDSDAFLAAIQKADVKQGILLFVKRAGAATFVMLKDE
jgi:Do/DeqQ family serine protease